MMMMKYTRRRLVAVAAFGEKHIHASGLCPSVRPEFFPDVDAVDQLQYDVFSKPLARWQSPQGHCRQ